MDYSKMDGLLLHGLSGLDTEWAGKGASLPSVKAPFQCADCTAPRWLLRRTALPPAGCSGGLHCLCWLLCCLRLLLAIMLPNPVQLRDSSAPNEEVDTEEVPVLRNDD